MSYAPIAPTNIKSWPSTPSTFLDVLQHQALSRPHQVAFRFLLDGEVESSTITFIELIQRARGVAGGLQAYGMQPGDRVLLLYPSGIEFIVAFLGCLYAGVVAVPTYSPKSKRHMPRLQAIAKDAQARLVLSTQAIITTNRQKMTYPSELETLPWVATDTGQWSECNQPVEVTSETLAFLQYTSGSTSQPKGVMVNHRNILHNESVIKAALQHDLETVYVSWLPLFHDMGLIGNVLQPLFLGVSCTFMPPVAFLQNPFCWLRAISKYQATTSGGPNFAYDLCVEKVTQAQKAELDLSHWSIAFSGAEPVRAHTLKSFADAFAPCGFRAASFYPCYGMAETTLMVTGGQASTAPLMRTFSQSALKQGKAQPEDSNLAQTLVSNGQPILDLNVMIVVPETHVPCATGQVGEIWVAGDSVAQGYWQRPQETLQTFQAYLSNQSNGPFLRTGDLGFFQDGELYFAGRLKDTIIIHGKNYYPQDIELTVEQSHPDVRSHCSAAVAVDVEDSEQLLIIAEVDRHCKDHNQVISAVRTSVTTHHEVPVYGVILVRTASIPKTSSGKIQRHACRQQFLDKQLLIVADAYYKGETNAQKTTSSSPLANPACHIDAIQRWIEQWLITKLELLPHQISDECTFVDYGLDSVSAAELMTGLEAQFNQQLLIEPELIWDYPTVKSLSQYVHQLIHSESNDVTALDAIANPNADPVETYEQIPQVLNRATNQRNRQVYIDGRWVCDFASCNYLGLDLHPQVQQAISPAIQKWGTHPSWTRAVASPDLYSELERALSQLLKAPDTLVFPSLTLLHLGVLPILSGKDGVIFMDNAVHRSVAEACRLAKQNGTQVISFRHNDLEDLATKLSQQAETQTQLIVIDGVYSMSANYADLPAVVALAQQFEATVYVDDAHGFGLIGENPTPEMPYGHKGNGIVNYYGLNYAKDRIVYCAGLSKAFSSYGAFVTCTDIQMKKSLATAWTAIFSGPSPVASLSSAIAGLEVNRTEGERLRQRIYHLTHKLVTETRTLGFEVDGARYFPIVSVVIGSVEAAVHACKILWEHGILITPGIFPAVPRDRNVLRFSITASNTEPEIDQALEALRAVHNQSLKTPNLK